MAYGQHFSYDSAQRPLHIVIAGAGPSGIAMAIALLDLKSVTFTVFDKNADVGGTWYENRYLGAACDVASHAYQYTFASNHEWSSHFSPAPEIGDYFKGVATKYDILKHVTLQTRIISAIYDESRSKWSITSHDSNDVKDVVEADIFINASGILNKWKWPDIPGLHDFSGKLLHTASWDAGWNWTGQRVGVIGSGATGIQVVPKLQQQASNLEVFVRSPTYILPSIGFGIESSSFNEAYTDEQKHRFRTDSGHYRTFRKNIEQQMNENFAGSIKNSDAQVKGRQWAEDMMRKHIKSKVLQEKLIPKRLTPGKPYLEAVQESNVDIVTEGIDTIVKEGIKTMDGRCHNLDAIVCATGFDTSFTPSFELIGLNGVDLRTRWKENPAESYMGLAVAGFPNYWTFLGPNTPIANGSLIPCIEWSAKYIVQMIQKVQREQIKSLKVKQNVQDAFNRYTQAVHKDLIWTDKDNRSNRVTAVWPGSSIHFMDIVNSPRWEDYDIQYVNDNPFAFMGNGISEREAAGADLTYYLDGI